jgi:hypothetical protein
MISDSGINIFVEYRTFSQKALENTSKNIYYYIEVNYSLRAYL